MSAIDNIEVTDPTVVDLKDVQLSEILKHNDHPSSLEPKIRKPKRILHFSDGTLEEFDEDETDDDNLHLPDDVEKPFHKTKATGNDSLTSERQINTRTLSWPGWFKHYTMAGSSRTLNFLDNVGESVAWYLGITSPKYQYEIDEYNRAKQEMIAENKAAQADLNSWAVGATSSQKPIMKEMKALKINDSTHRETKVDEEETVN